MPRRRRRKALPSGLFDAQIESLSHDGRGIAHIEGKVTFIDAALPGEQVRFEYTYQRKQFDEGKAVEVLKPSADRVAEPCEFARLCGGCSLQHMASDAQVAFKERALIEQFHHIAGCELPEHLPAIRSETLAYRRKARLAVKYVAKKGKVLVGFREKRNSFIADIDRCEVLAAEIGQELKALATMIEQLDGRSSIPQIELAKGDDAVALVFRHLETLSEADLLRIKAFCRDRDFHLYLQPDGPETIRRLSVDDSDTTSELLERLHYQLPEFGIQYAFHPSDFTQVHEGVNRQMVSRVIELLKPEKNELVLDLFCGLGNFSLPLASRAGEVIGVEGSSAMVERAYENARLNQLSNLDFFAANLDQDISRLASDPESWVHRPYVKMLIDPPRSGAQAVVENINIFKDLHTLLYVSCNPATLARDAGILRQQGFSLMAGGVMDMFPHTNHVESLAVFRKNALN